MRGRVPAKTLRVGYIASQHRACGDAVKIFVRPQDQIQVGIIFNVALAAREALADFDK